MRYQEDMTPIEWEIDEHGKRFRRIGKGCIEYAPTITLAGGIEIYEDELEDFHKRQKEAEERRKAAAEEAWRNRPPARSCPFATDPTHYASVSNAKFSMMGNAVLPLLPMP